MENVRNEEVDSSLNKNTVVEKKYNQLNLPASVYKTMKTYLRLKQIQDLEEPPDEPSFEWNKTIRTYSRKYKNEAALTDEFVKLSSVKKVMGPLKKRTTESKESLLIEKNDTEPFTLDTFCYNSGSTDSANITSIKPIVECLEVASEEDDNENEAIVEGVSCYNFPVQNHDRAISITCINNIPPEFLKKLSENEIRIHDYGSKEMINKRILLFGSVLVCCPMCNRTLEGQKMFKNHFRNVHKNVKLPKSEYDTLYDYIIRPIRKRRPLLVRPCPVCKIYVSSLTRHQCKDPREFNPYICKECHKTFKAKTSYVRHMRLFREFERCDLRKCYICPEMVSRKDYSSHVKAHNTFICEECGFSFLSAFTLKQHAKAHRKERRCKQDLCPVCGKLTTQLGYHMQVHESGPRTYMCHKCPKFFPSSHNLKRHLGHHVKEKPECSECKIKYKTAASLASHYKLKHSQIFRHTCDICGKGFSRTDYFKRHMNMHITGTILTYKARTCYIREKPSNPVRCKFCSKLFKTVYLLRTHLISSHVKRIRYKCRMCNITFSSLQTRFKHEKRHKDPLYHLSCKICWRRMQTKEDLDKHLITHENSKKYFCQFCEQAFCRKYLLDSHISEKHTDKEELEKEKKAVLDEALEEFFLVPKHLGLVKTN